MADVMDDEIAVAQRFAQLLKPIRDLTVSFDVDVSGALEEYLQETIELLEDSTNETLDKEGVNKALQQFNFAEAGLLIQGSAAVYGRKVRDRSCAYATLLSITRTLALRGAGGILTQARVRSARVPRDTQGGQHRRRGRRRGGNRCRGRRW